MAKKRPPAITAIAVLNLVFGGMGLLGMLCAGLGVGILAIVFTNLPAPAPGEPSPGEVFGGMYEHVDAEAPSLKFVLGAAILIGCIMTVILFSSGFGLLKMRPWGRTWSLVYAVVTIVLGLINTGYMTAVGSPAMNRGMVKWQDDLSKKMQAKGKPGLPPQPMPDPTLSAVQNVVYGIIGMIYPVAILIVMNLKTVKRALRPGSADDDRTDDRREDLDYDDRRSD
jgi:hypothetical protein